MRGLRTWVDCSWSLSVRMALFAGLGFAAAAGALRAHGEKGIERPSAVEAVWVERESFAMGTRLRIRVQADDRPTGISAIDEAMGSVRLHEAMLSSWTRESEISRINEAEVNAAIPLSAGLSELLAEAVGWSEETGGAFQPVMGALIDVWGVRGAGRVPRKEEVDGALLAVGPGTINFDPIGGTATRRDPAAWIDAGGFGKGAALRVAARKLREAGVEDALLDFGGQLMALGAAAPDQTGWPVSVAHPQTRFESKVGLNLSNASVATSGTSERPAHILDPRTGQPVPPWGSVTVVSQDPLAADAVATALFVLGPEDGMEWARARSDVGVLFLVAAPGGQIERRQNLRMALWLEEEGES